MNASLVRIGAIALSAALVVPLGTAVPLGTSVARADVVFGNLGTSGTGNLSTFGTDIFSSGFTAAQGFTTGSSAEVLSLQSVTLGLFASSPTSISVKLLGSLSSLPDPTNVIATSSAQTISAEGRYTFSFSNQQLAAGTQYWVTPDAVTGLFWYLAQGLNSQPTGLNGSGYTWVAAAESANGGASWAAAIQDNRYSVSVSAVPEPSTYALAATALGLCGIVAARRRDRS